MSVEKNKSNGHMEKVGTVKQRSNRQSYMGKVVSKKTDKTVKVLVSRKAAHPIYKKIISLNKNYLAHDETNELAVGDSVELFQTRPLSAKKRHRAVLLKKGNLL